MNTRQGITRSITYSMVTVCCEGESSTHVVYGETTPKKEMKKFFKNYEGDDIPTINVEVITEKRIIGLDEFLEKSTIINESEEN
ncbi:MAG: hypothetical protein RSF67_08935 [Clostridia bacterium]